MRRWIGYLLLGLMLWGGVSCAPTADSPPPTVPLGTGRNYFLTPPPEACVTAAPATADGAVTFDCSEPTPDPLSADKVATVVAVATPIPPVAGGYRASSTQLLVPNSDLDIVGFTYYDLVEDTLYWVAKLANGESDILQTDMATWQTERLNIPEDRRGFAYLRASEHHISWHGRWADPPMLYSYNLQTHQFDFEKPLEYPLQPEQIDAGADLLVWYDSATRHVHGYDLNSGQERILIEESGLAWPTVCAQEWVAYVQNYDPDSRRSDLMLLHVPTGQKTQVGRLDLTPTLFRAFISFGCDEEHLLWREEGLLRLYHLDTAVTTTLTHFQGAIAPHADPLHIDGDLIIVSSHPGGRLVGYDLQTDTLFSALIDRPRIPPPKVLANQRIIWVQTNRYNHLKLFVVEFTRE